jgi:hypothetical protein
MFGFLGRKKSQDNKSTQIKTKKGKGYFLELDETGNVKSPGEEKKPEPAKEPAKEKEPTASQKETVQIEAQPKPPAPAISNGKAEPQGELTFAPNFLLPTPTTSRRRPGPSMDMYREIARQVNPRS